MHSLDAFRIQSDRTKPTPLELTDFDDRWKREVGALGVIQRQWNERIRSDLAKDTSHAVRAVTLGPADEMIQCFSRLDGKLFLEQSAPLIHFGGHKMNSYPHGLFTMIHLPKGWHHALVTWKRSVVNIDTASRWQGQKCLFQYVRAGNRDDQISRALPNGFDELGRVWVANPLEWDAVRSRCLLKAKELSGLGALPDLTQDAALCASPEQPDEPDNTVERHELP